MSLKYLLECLVLRQGCERGNASRGEVMLEGLEGERPFLEAGREGEYF